MKSYRLQDLSVNELQAYLKRAKHKTIIIPYGLCEQHGFHLPLDVDIRNADYISPKLAAKLDCLVAPTLNYTFSGGMLPGTINCKPNTVSNLIGEIIESLALTGFDNFIIIPGHGGSESMMHLKESLRIQKWLNPMLRDKMILLAPIWNFSPTWTKLFTEQDYHAAWAETSLLLHWCPEVVRPNIVMDEPEVAERLRSDPDSYQLRESFSTLKEEVVQTSQREDVKVGVMGYPEKASAELGAKIEAEFVEIGSKALLQAIAEAEAARTSGQRVTHEDNDHLKIMNI